VQSGVAFVGFAGTVVIVSNIAQIIVGRIGVRATLTAGLLTSALSVALLTRLPVRGHYFWDLFPAFVLGGAGMGLSFVPVTIGGLTGVNRADAGVASGLINTSRQIGGAIGIAATTAIAAAATSQSASTVDSVAALDHGYQTALVVLAGMLVVGAGIAAVFLRPAQTMDVAIAPTPHVDPPRAPAFSSEQNGHEPALTAPAVLDEAA
jgi:MFS family permease